MSKYNLRRKIDRFSRWKQYFLRGHNAWFSLVFSLINFTLIFYQLLVVNLDFVPEFLKSYFIFVILFSCSYFPLSTLLGFLDFRKGTYAAEQNLSKEVSPVWRDLFTKIAKLENNDTLILAILENNKKES